MEIEPESIAISRFKATCLELLKRVKQTGQPLLVTRNGEPIAMIMPPPEPNKPTSWIGKFQSTGKITGDILSPVLDEKDWDALSS